MVKIGMRFWVKPAFLKRDDGRSESKVQKGTVVYVHPKGRYAVLKFDGILGEPRETFPLLELTEQNIAREKKK